MWAVAAIVVVVVAIAGYAIIRFSKASSENIPPRLRIRYAGQQNTGSAANQELFRCYGKTAAVAQKGGEVVCGLARGQHATGFWWDGGPNGVDFSGGGAFGNDGTGYVCADVWLGANGTSAYITTEVPNKRPETKGGVKSNFSSTGRTDRICAPFTLDPPAFWANTLWQLAGDVIIARLYNASPANVAGGTVTVSKFYLMQN